MRSTKSRLCDCEFVMDSRQWHCHCEVEAFPRNSSYYSIQRVWNCHHNDKVNVHISRVWHLNFLGKSRDGRASHARICQKWRHLRDCRRRRSASCLPPASRPFRPPRPRLPSGLATRTTPTFPENLYREVGLPGKRDKVGSASGTTPTRRPPRGTPRGGPCSTAGASASPGMDGVDLGLISRFFKSACRLHFFAFDKTRGVQIDESGRSFELDKSIEHKRHATNYQVREDQEGRGGGDRGHQEPPEGRQGREEGARREARLAVEADHGAPAVVRGRVATGNSMDSVRFRAILRVLLRLGMPLNLEISRWANFRGDYGSLRVSF